MNQGTKVGLFAAAFFILLGIAGRTDYTEETLSNMTEETYEAVKEELGDKASDYEIAKEYNSNREYYDSLPNR